MTNPSHPSGVAPRTGDSGGLADDFKTRVVRLSPSVPRISDKDDPGNSRKLTSEPGNNIIFVSNWLLSSTFCLPEYIRQISRGSEWWA